MSISKRPYQVQPAFNEIEVIDSDETSIEVAEIGGKSRAVTLHHVQTAEGAKFDLKNFVSKLFYDATVPLVDSGWAVRDYNLYVKYSVTDITSGYTEEYGAVNAVVRRGESLDMFNEGRSAALTMRDIIDTVDEDGADALIIRVPAYDGFPAGMSFMYKGFYGLDTTNATVFTVELTGTQRQVNLPINVPSDTTGWILWGDGSYSSMEVGNIATPVHYYMAAGTYTITIVHASGPMYNMGGTYIADNWRTAIRTIEKLDPDLVLFRCYRWDGLLHVNAIAGNLNETSQSQSMFYQCANLLSVNPQFFSNTDLTAETLYQTFYQCKSLTDEGISEDIFKNAKSFSCKNVTQIFYGCTALTQMKDWFPFDSIESFTSMFFGTAMNTINDQIFAGMPNLVSVVGPFNQTFTNAPANIFENNPKLETVNTIYKYYTSGPDVQASDYANMFANNPLLKSVGSLMSYRFKGVLPNIFANNPNIESVKEAFSRCTGLTGINSSLFSNCTKLKSIYAVFHECKGLQNGIEDLYVNCPLIENAALAYMSVGYTNALTIPTTMFANNPLINNFADCFRDWLGSTTTTPVDGAGLKLWERAGQPGYPATIDGTRCFYKDTLFTDYDSIPNSWKGLAGRMDELAVADEVHEIFEPSIPKRTSGVVPLVDDATTISLIAEFADGSLESCTLSSVDIQHVHAEFIYGEESIQKFIVQGGIIPTDPLEVEFYEDCIPEYPAYLRWINPLGGWEYFMFKWGKIYGYEASPTFDFQPYTGASTDSHETHVTGGLDYKETLTMGQDQLERPVFDMLKTIITSPKIQHWNVERQAWESAILDGKTTTQWNTRNSRGTVSFVLRLIDQKVQF